MAVTEAEVEEPTGTGGSAAAPHCLSAGLVVMDMLSCDDSRCCCDGGDWLLVAGYDGGADEGDGEGTDGPIGFSIPNVMTGGGDERKAFGEYVDPLPLVVIKLLVWLRLPYRLAAAAGTAVVVGLEETGCIGGEGMGRARDLGDVDEVERERVDVTGRLAECECVCEGDGDCCGSAMRNDVTDDDTDGS